MIYYTAMDLDIGEQASSVTSNKLSPAPPPPAVVCQGSGKSLLSLYSGYSGSIKALLSSIKVLAALTRCENAFSRSCSRRAAKTRSRSRSRRALGHHTSTPRRSNIDASYAFIHIDASYAGIPRRCYTDSSTLDLRLHIFI